VHGLAGIDRCHVYFFPETQFTPILAPNRRTSKMTVLKTSSLAVKKDENFKVVFAGLTGMKYGHQILVWPIAALPNVLSANQKGVFSVTRDAETGFKGLGLRV